MKQVNIHEAKAQLSRLIDIAEQGEEVIIARHNRPVARLQPIRRVARKPGLMKGRIRMREDFDAPLPDDWLNAFEGREA